MTLSAANLATIKADAKVYLRIDGEDDLLDLIIQNVFDAVEGELGRAFYSTTYSETYRPIGGSVLLNQPDVTQVTAVFDETESGLTATYTGTDTHARVEVTSSAVETVSRVGATTTTTTSTFAANVTTAAMATTINALAGWTAAVVNSRPAAYLVRTGVRDAKDLTVTLEVWDDTGCEFETDYEAGMIWLVGGGRFASGGYSAGHHLDRGGEIRVDYTAGFSALPEDANGAILEAIKWVFDGTRRGAGLKSENLGDYSYTNADVTALALDAAQRAGRVLQHYARTKVIL